MKFPSDETVLMESCTVIGEGKISELAAITEKRRLGKFNVVKLENLVGGSR